MDGGFIATLAEKVDSGAAFIIIIVALIGIGLWKMWGEMKHLLLDREHTAEKRGAEIGQLQNQYTKLEGMITSHFQIHLGLEKDMKEFRDIKERFVRLETKIDLLLERGIPKPKLPK